ncbi:hypothetical protein [Modestobacter sp. NPDC049651]|uniref:hypothetical protein n=1 Tax=unclassified Modestobacter TaxID=2643866 RepID=UPI0033CAA01F
MTRTPGPRAAVMQAGGAWIAEEAAAQLFPILQNVIGRQVQAGQAPPLLRQSYEALRESAQHHWNHQGTCPSVNGHAVPTSTDIPRSSSRRRPDGLLTTAQVADRLTCTARHVPRLARRAGVEPVPDSYRPRLWTPQAVAAMAAHRCT